MDKNKCIEMRPGTLSQKFIDNAWLAVRHVLNSYWDSDDIRAYWRYFYNYHRLNVDPYSYDGSYEVLSSENSDPTYREIKRWLKEEITQGEYNGIIQLLDNMLYVPNIPRQLYESIETCFNNFAPYYHINHSRHPMHIFPRSSNRMGENNERAQRNIEQSNLRLSITQLDSARNSINNNEYAASICFSIHAVATTAREIDPKASESLKYALNSLERHGMIKNPALIRAFNTLYGYTCSGGMRHEPVENNFVEVGYDEAIFMYGICVSFVDYLISKKGQIKEK